MLITPPYHCGVVESAGRWPNLGFVYIAGELEQAGLKLLAQHIDPLDVGTLIDIFRSEEHTCLLGTDAVRDGIDVPGNALRLIVFDRVPWPRPDILTRARRAAFGGRAYDDMQIRFRLKQAYGRLIRRASDRAAVSIEGPPASPARSASRENEPAYRRSGSRRPTSCRCTACSPPLGSWRIC